MLSGKNFIGNKRSQQSKTSFTAINPVDASEILPDFFEATIDEVDEAIQLAGAAFGVYKNSSGIDRANFLDTIAAEILELGDILINRACAETGLPTGRITGERGRTMNQLKMFASVLREGSWRDARIETAIPDRQPAPKSDLRSIQIAIGPVGIFGASNFPLAFSVAGGDTASALASGCPVIVKAHPSHPGTCELIAGAVLSAIEKCNMPNGTFSMVHGISHKVGMAIVENPDIKAVGFTGSYKGGKALFDAANQREEPIPVYAEMGSVNPIFLLPQALKNGTNDLALGLFNSFTLGVGQFCTNPGLVFTENSEVSDNFEAALLSNVNASSSGIMLNEGICKNYRSGVKNLAEEDEVEVVASGDKSDNGYGAEANIFKTTVNDFLTKDILEEEIFGPTTTVVRASTKEELLSAATKLKGHLTATIFGTDEDLQQYKELVDILQLKVGRLIINNFPTGVEVCHAMVHGGPFPSTTNAQSTSVGSAAINRFTRPICYQNFPQHLLPAELNDQNSLNIWRLVNGSYQK
ncbi:MAG: alpha-ketoglutaric semialdehyde dehydrogenase [Saprospiraceae bacterium]|jgi:alpha-ketoglutaric semialdehyde dehydrogenase